LAVDADGISHYLTNCWPNAWRIGVSAGKRRQKILQLFSSDNRAVGDGGAICVKSIVYRGNQAARRIVRT